MPRTTWLVGLAVVLLAAPGRAERAPRCTFGMGALPSQTAPHLPHGAKIPIDNIVVLMQENRSFDHYFGQIHFEGQKKVRAVPRQHSSNPDPTNPGGPAISRFHQDHYCEVADLDHSWNGTHNEWDGGKMDGFTAANVNTNDPNGSRTMGWYDQSDLPFYYALYATFAMADRFFCSTLTQTFPNRFYLLAGTSFGHIKNDFPTSGTEYSQRTIFNVLDEAGVTWKIYFSQLPFGDLFAYVRNHQANVVPVQQFTTDAAAGTLPQVSFVDPIFLAAANVENDEHPPSNIQVGQQFVSSVVGAFVNSPQWSHGALLLTYDEHGGYFDHVPPPRACTPDDIEPMLAQTDYQGHFDRYGIRVPFVAVSPYARKHYVSHRVYDHTSILRFIETRFDLPALTRRDANADALLRLFKFSRPSFPTPPPLPPATIDQAQFDACANAPPPSP